MDKKIQNIETALIIIAEAVEVGSQKGLENNIREILGWETFPINSSF